MASINATADAAAVQTPPVVADLTAVFAALEDGELLAALAGPRRRGPKGHPLRALWRCFVAKHRLGLHSTDAMIRALHDNPYLAAVCGIDSPEAIPHKSTFSRFFAKLARDRMSLSMVKDVSRRLVRHHYETLPGFGERVALDSTTLKGWANGGKGKKVDPDAGWSVKRGTQGVKEYVFGYKLHLLVDCEYELPIAAHVSAGNVNDSVRASNVLSEARVAAPGFHPRALMADAGYSGAAFQVLLTRQYDIRRPVIDINKSHRRLLERLEGWYGSPEWKALYSQRQAVERAFSRLKGQRSLNHITVRRRRKVTVHCYLSLIAMQAGATRIGANLAGAMVHSVEA
ncbi:MAG: transposase [Chloroflexi bacterium]|nr:transposase [Chloroflexota bacterium]